MNERTAAAAAPDVATAARHYRAIWRDCLIAGFVGMLYLAPLLTGAQVDLEVAAGLPQGPGMREAIEGGGAPNSWLAWSIVVVSLGCLLCAGRFSPHRVIAGTLLLIAGACLVVSDDWIRIENNWKAGAWTAPALYGYFEVGVWIACAIDAAVALLLLARVRAAPGSSTYSLGDGKLRTVRPTPATLAPHLPDFAAVVDGRGVVATFLMALALIWVNGLFAFYVLGRPWKGFRDPIG